MTSKHIARFDHFSENCPICAGLGTVTRFYGGGIYDSTIDCERCLGRGRIGNCANCEGTGKINEGELDCPKCRGVGAIGDCQYCEGVGVAQTVDDGATGADCPHCDGLGFITSHDK